MKYKFRSAKEMLDTIQRGNDLFCPDEELYVFEYNNEGAVCSYRLNMWEAMKLQDMAVELSDYWGLSSGLVEAFMTILLTTVLIQYTIHLTLSFARNTTSMNGLTAKMCQLCRNKRYIVYKVLI